MLNFIFLNLHLNNIVKGMSVWEHDRDCANSNSTQPWEKHEGKEKDEKHRQWMTSQQIIFKNTPHNWLLHILKMPPAAVIVYIPEPPHSKVQPHRSTCEILVDKTEIP